MQKYTWYLGADIPNTDQTVNREQVENKAAEVFNDSGCTIREATGTWKGDTEGNFLIEHLSDDMTEEEAKQVAQTLKEEFSQESVMFERTETEATFV